MQWTAALAALAVACVVALVTGRSVTRSGRLLALKMTATAHFMRHRYSGFDAPLEIVPPSSAG